MQSIRSSLTGQPVSIPKRQPAPDMTGMEDRCDGLEEQISELQEQLRETTKDLTGYALKAMEAAVKAASRPEPARGPDPALASLQAMIQGLDSRITGINAAIQEVKQVAAEKPEGEDTPAPAPQIDMQAIVATIRQELAQSNAGGGGDVRVRVTGRDANGYIQDFVIQKGVKS